MRQALGTALFERAAAIDAALLAVPDRVSFTSSSLTVIVMASVSVPNVPRQHFDYSRVSLLGGIHQRETHVTPTRFRHFTEPRSS